MKVFVAGASGAIGLPLVEALLEAGHVVTAMTRSQAGSARIEALGARAALVDAFDAAAVRVALDAAAPDAVIDELTALPASPAELPEYLPGDRRLRLEGGQNLLDAALAVGVGRYLQQSSGFFLAGNGALADENSSLDHAATPGILSSVTMYTELETRLTAASITGVCLRYGFFYGPRTWYHPAGASAEQVRQQQFPVIDGGNGRWSFVHIDDAARATVAALDAPAGRYVVVDDDPLPVSTWLPAFARFVGAPEPPVVSQEAALSVAGADAVYYQCSLSGASNALARKVLGFRPRRLEWL